MAQKGRPNKISQGTKLSPPTEKKRPQFQTGRDHVKNVNRGIKTSQKII